MTEFVRETKMRNSPVLLRAFFNSTKLRRNCVDNNVAMVSYTLYGGARVSPRRVQQYTLRLIDRL